MTPLIVHSIVYQDPLQVFRYFEKDSWSVFLDSSNVLQCPSSINRYSYIALDPFLKITFKNQQLCFNHQQILCADPLAYLKTQLCAYHIPANPLYPPFQGGFVGYFAYDLCHYLECIPYARFDEMDYPDLAVGMYDVVISFDHVQQKAWVLCQGLSEKHTQPQRMIAQKKLDNVILRFHHDQNKKKSHLKTKKSSTEWKIDRSAITSNFTRAEYEQAVLKMKAYIQAGDIFEANLSQRFVTSFFSQSAAFELYCRLRSLNPSSFAAYLNLDECIIASASPERFLLLKDRCVETRPIKGTRPRAKMAVADQILADELRHSVKDHAENVMIVDLMRNDLSKVCEDHSIVVKKLCSLESYPFVHHLVSVISARLHASYDALDLLKASFPGGSITGAPKIRAMQIISSLEPNRRGPYCGSIGYIGFDGQMDLSITIRTYMIKNNQLSFHVGGAIVLDSDPAAEYLETLHKAVPLFQALGA